MNERLNWLLIGGGLGISLGRDNLFITLFGIFIFLIGFVLQLIDDRELKKSLGGKNE